MIPGSSELRFIGETFDFIEDNLGMTLTNYKKYGPVFRMSLVFQNIVNTVGPEFLCQVSLDQDKVFQLRSDGKAWLESSSRAA